MVTFYLIRHGDRVSRSEDTELSSVGLQQVAQTAQYLQDKSIDAIFASPLPRTQQTAQIIADVLQLPFTTDDRLQERIIFDATKGKTFEEFLMEWDKTMVDRMYQPLYGDSAWNAGERMKNVLNELPDNRTYLIVSHGGIIGDLLRNIFSDDTLIFKTDPTSLHSWVDICVCSITEVEKNGDTFELKRVNDTSHLVENV
jgi:broad specificity phosphatase PhoE